MQLAAERFAKTFGSADHFPFAHDGEATLLLRHAPDDERVYRLSAGDAGMSSTDETLRQFVSRHVGLARRRSDRFRNENKSWAVQFVVNANDEARIIDVLRSAVGIDDPGTDWSKVEISRSHVKCCSRMLTRRGLPIPLKRQEHESWKTASFYLNWQEPVLELQQGSIIGEMDRAFHESKLNYILVDYGLLPLPKA
ncbi:MAG TPA: hypothetical protein VFE47_27140 [Tepidisphaeraceae bacterium]|jgi:hypothetical protein|nr:hypothetical protein [Tepidisphaeraceae bacterium]